MRTKKIYENINFLKPKSDDEVQQAFKTVSPDEYEFAFADEFLKYNKFNKYTNNKTLVKMIRKMINQGFHDKIDPVTLAKEAANECKRVLNESILAPKSKEEIKNELKKYYPFDDVISIKMERPGSEFSQIWDRILNITSVSNYDNDEIVITGDLYDIFSIVKDFYYFNSGDLLRFLKNNLYNLNESVLKPKSKDDVRNSLKQLLNIQGDVISIKVVRPRNVFNQDRLEAYVKRNNLKISKFDLVYFKVTGDIIDIYKFVDSFHAWPSELVSSHIKSSIIQGLNESVLQGKSKDDIKNSIKQALNIQNDIIFINIHAPNSIETSKIFNKWIKRNKIIFHKHLDNFLIISGDILDIYNFIFDYEYMPHSFIIPHIKSIIINESVLKGKSSKIKMVKMKTKFINENIFRSKVELKNVWKESYDYWFNEFVKKILKIEPNIKKYIAPEENDEYSSKEYFEYYYDHWKDNYYGHFTPEEAAKDFLNQLN